MKIHIHYNVSELNLFYLVYLQSRKQIKSGSQIILIFDKLMTPFFNKFYPKQGTPIIMHIAHIVASLLSRTR